MLRLLYLLPILFYPCLALSQKPAIPVPQGYFVIQSAEGDLDQDDIPELVVAYNTEELKERSFKNVTRDLIVYKRSGDQWVKWRSSTQALYGSRGGGMLGDPFDTLQIEQGILLITQQGGSSWKWHFTDKYRFQEEELYLIGYASMSGAPCEYWQEVDFNVSTGKMIIAKEWEDCDSEAAGKKISETVSVKDLKVTLQTRHDKRLHVVTPREGLEVFVSTGKH